jgi:hypothetical protein
MVKVLVCVSLVPLELILTPGLRVAVQIVLWVIGALPVYVFLVRPELQVAEEQPPLPLVPEVEVEANYILILLNKKPSHEKKRAFLFDIY